MDQSTDAHRPDWPVEGSFHAGQELFLSRSAGGDAVTFVCFPDGYAIRWNGAAVPGGWWPADQLETALAAYERLVAADPPATEAAPRPAA